MKKDITEFIQFENVTSGPNQVSACWKVNGELPFFEGHFPGNPILPAVCIIDISLHLVSLSNPQISLQEINIKRSKFMAMVHPGQDVELTAESTDEKSWKVLWKSASDQQKLAQVNLVI